MRLDVLDELIRSQGDTYTSLAQRLGITTASVSHKMTGKTQWKLSEVQKLRELYGLDLKDIEILFF